MRCDVSQTRNGTYNGLELKLSKSYRDTDSSIHFKIEFSRWCRDEAEQHAILLLMSKSANAKHTKEFDMLNSIPWGENR